MSTLDFKTHVKKIREEAKKIGYADNSLNSYIGIWNQYIKWKKTGNFVYNADEYIVFVKEHYNFDLTKVPTKRNHRTLIESKKILDDFDSYAIKKKNEMFPKALYNNYPDNWKNIIDNYINYCKNVKLNGENTLYSKKKYLERELAYFHSKDLKGLDKFTIETINTYINDTVKAGFESKRRNFNVLRDFLNYLFIEDIMDVDLSNYIPKIRRLGKRKLPTYLKQEQVEELLKSIKKNTKYEIRDYTIIIIASRLGLRVSDILNIKLKDIDWKNYKLKVLQPKTNNLNTLPLSREVGWAIIDYIKNSRPKCNNKYLFVKMRYPFDKMNKFYNFNKYFENTNIEVDKENKKGIHNLRHSLAKNMLDNDIPITTISSTLGHNNIDTTSNTYLKIDIKNLKKCCLEVDE